MATKEKGSSKRTSATKPLAGMEDEFEVPESVKEAADQYKKTSAAKSRANAKFKGAKEMLLESMNEHDVERVRVEYGDGKEKWLKRVDEETIKEEVIKETPDTPDVSETESE